MNGDERKDYEKAKRRIADVKATQTKKLSLSWLRNLTALPTEISALKHLNEFDISGTKINDFCPLESLSDLAVLHLRETKTDDFTTLSGLTQLSVLNLYASQIADAAPLADLTQLASLYLGNTEIEDATPLGALTCLTTLDISHTRVADLTPLTALLHLTSLYLYDTQIFDGTTLATLKHLTRLELDNCTGLTELNFPDAMLARLTILTLNNCNLADVPRELCRKGDFANVAGEVHAHFRALREQGAAHLSECKLLFLGNGRAGKTSARKALRGEAFDKDENSTHAIQLHRWDVDGVRVNVWDFGGQDIYHQSHRLFLKTRAIFVVCWNPWEDREALLAADDEPRGLAYWIEQVCSQNMDAAILILRTHADEDVKELQARGLGRVPDWRVGVSDEYHYLPYLAIGSEARDPTAIKAVNDWIKDAIAAEQTANPAPRPAGWVAVREALATMEAKNTAAFEQRLPPPHAVLSAAEFDTLTKAHLPPETWERDFPFVRGFLHDIGALYYDERLSGRVIVDQRWAIEGIYAVLRPCPFRDWLRENGGTFTARELEPQWTRRGYSNAEQALLLEFMQACGQAAEIMRADETANEEAVYLSPSLLPLPAEVRNKVPSISTNPNKGNQIIEHERIGADAACAVIVEFAKVFGRRAIYWRWGCYVTVERTGVVMCVQWSGHKDGGYAGGFTIEVDGPAAEAVEARCTIQGVIAPYVPSDARSGWDSGMNQIFERMHARDAARFQGRHDSDIPVCDAKPLAEIADDRATIQGRYLSFSIAGENPNNPGIEGAPLALYGALSPIAKQRGWEVFYYKNSTDQPDVKGLLRHVGIADYVVVFLSKKYLASEYCMEELRRAYEAEPKGQFPPEATRLFGFPDWRPAGYKAWIALADGWRNALAVKQAEWGERHKGLLLRVEKLNEVLKNEPAYGWFTMCDNEGELALFQRALENYAATDAPLAFDSSNAEHQAWLEKWTPEIATRMGL